jgi:hypothetical protein
MINLQPPPIGRKDTRFSGDTRLEFTDFQALVKTQSGLFSIPKLDEVRAFSWPKPISMCTTWRFFSSYEAGCMSGSTHFKVPPIGDRFHLCFTPFLVRKTWL